MNWKRKNHRKLNFQFIFLNVTQAEGDKRRIRDLEGRLVNAEAANSSLQRKCYAFNDVKANLENEVNNMFG